jgi:hypothetical protein
MWEGILSSPDELRAELEDALSRFDLLDAPTGAALEIARELHWRSTFAAAEGDRAVGASERFSAILTASTVVASLRLVGCSSSPGSQRQMAVAVADEVVGRAQELPPDATASTCIEALTQRERRDTDDLEQWQLDDAPLFIELAARFAAPMLRRR